MRFGLLSFAKYIATVLTAVMFFVQAPLVFGALASPASDTLSRLQTGVAADHQIVFLSPSGINAATDTITLDLSSFTTGSVDAGDIAVSWGPTTGFEHPTSVAALPGAGTWGAAFSSGVLTLTAPTDAAGASQIPAGQMVGVLIGLNAGGTDQLTNPASAGAVFIALGGTFGDSNTIAVVIVSSDSVTVSGTVPASSTTSTPPCVGCGGGGGGGGGAVAPVISNVQATNITTSSATITWSTDQASDSQVAYGLTVSYASGTVSDAAQVTNHSVSLSGLTPDTTYHFRVSSLNSQTQLGATSGDFTFTTLAAPAVPVPLAITNVQVVAITDTSALVTWNTNKPASSLVDFGLTQAYGQNASQAGLVTSHAVQLSGLNAGTAYHYFVTSHDGGTDTATSSDAVFVTTSDLTPPANVINLSVTPGDSMNTLNWTNPPDPDFAGVKVLQKLGGFPTGPFDGVVIYDGNGVTTVDTGLANGTTYYYGAYAYDTHGNFASGALGQGTPVGPPPPQPPTSTPPVPPQPPTTSTQPTPPTPAQVQQPVSTTTTPPVAPTPTSALTVLYYGNGGSVPLTADASGVVGTLAGVSTRVVLSLAGLSSVPKSVTASIGGNLYAMQYIPSESAFAATFVVPSPGLVSARVTVVFEDGSQQQVLHTLKVQVGGVVVESALIGETENRVPGAQVVLYREVGGAWTSYAQQQTSVDGAYAFVVPNGRYYVEVTADGYQKYVSVPEFVGYNVYGQRVALIQSPVEIPSLDTTRPLAPQVAEISRAVVQNASSLVQQVVKDPEVQEAAETTAPVLAAFALVNAASALSLFNALAYLQYVFTQPLLLLHRKKKKKWGVVYNSLTKKPIELAIVRLLQFETRLVIQTKVTDNLGRYSFDVGKGNYLIEVVKPGYVFPSEFLKDKKEDVEMVDLYFGTKVEVVQLSSIIALNIALDPVVREETPQRVLWRKAFQVARQVVALLGVVFGSLIVIIQPTFVNGLLLLGQVAVYLLFRRLGQRASGEKWGAVVDAKTKKPLQNVVVRIFDKKFNKLLETQVTDRNGKYGFYVGKNVYYVTGQKAGYELYVSPDLDLTRKEGAVVDQNITMKPLKKV